MCQASGLKGGSVPRQRTTREEEREAINMEKVTCVLSSGPSL